MLSSRLFIRFLAAALIFASATIIALPYIPGSWIAETEDVNDAFEAFFRGLDQSYKIRGDRFDQLYDKVDLQLGQAFRKSDIYRELRRSGFHSSALLERGEAVVWHGANPGSYEFSKTGTFELDQSGTHFINSRDFPSIKNSLWARFEVQELIHEVIEKTDLPLSWYPNVSTVADTSRDRLFRIGNRVAGLIAWNNNEVALQIDQSRAELSVFFACLVAVLLVIFHLSCWEIYASRHAFLIQILSSVLFWVILELGYFQQQLHYVIQSEVVSAGLVRFLIQDLLLLSVGYSVMRFFIPRRRFFGITWYPRTIAFSLLLGVLSAISWYYGPVWLSNPLMDGFIPLYTKEMVPSFSYLVYLVAVFIGFVSIFGSLLTLTWFLLGSEQDQLDWVPPLTVAGFALTYVFILLVLEQGPLLVPHVILSVSMFLFTFWLANRVFNQPRLFLFFSRIRLIAALTLICSLWFYWYLFQAHQQRSIAKAESVIEELTLKQPILASHSESLVRLYADELFFRFSEEGYDTLSALQNIIRELKLESQSDYRWSGYLERGNMLIPFFVPQVGVQTTSGAEVDLRSMRRFSHTLSNGIKMKLMGSLRPDFLIPGSYSGLRIIPTGLEASNLSNPEAYSRIFKRQGFGGRDFGVYLERITFTEHAFQLARMFFLMLIFSWLTFGLLKILAGRHYHIMQSPQMLRFRLVDGFMLVSLAFLSLLIVSADLILTNFARQSEEPAIKELSSETAGPVYEFQEGKLTHDPYPGSELSRKLGKRLPFEIKETMETAQLAIFDVADHRLRFTKKVSEISPLVSAEVLMPRGQNPLLYSLSSSIIVVFLACFGVFLFVMAFITRHVTQPLSALSTGLRRVATGELKSAIKITSQDEVGELANAYNVMIYRLQDLQEELAEAEREAAWSEMARQVAHEIKNPLTPMKLSLQHLSRVAGQESRSKEELLEDLRKTVDSVVRQIESLAHIASDFSRFARPLEASFEPVQVHQMLMEVAELYRHDPKINLVFDLVERDLTISGARDDLKRVFINLIKNSDEAMPDGGIILLRTYTYKENVIIEVVDNGDGIPVEEQSKIFTPNFSTKTSGTGLGLAICKKIIETHKGDISFASVPGAGTTFTITIPQA